MKVIKHGKLVKRFECHMCGCVFEAAPRDAKIIPRTGQSLYYYYPCPECENLLRTRKNGNK